MNNKQVGITKPLMVVSDLLTAITQGHPKLKFVVDLVNMLYGSMRDKFKVGKIYKKDIEDTIASFPKYMKDQITNEKVFKKAELDIVFDRLIKHSELVSFQNKNLNKHTSTKPTNILQTEKELSKENLFLISTDDMQLTHAGMFSTIAVLPFIDPNMAEQELLLSYLSHIPEVVAVFKLTNMRIMAQVDEEQAVNNNIVTFKTPSFLAMATTATVNNTDIVPLMVDLGTTGVVLNNDHKLKLGLDEIEISNFSALAENETALLPNIEKGKEVIEKIIDKLIQNSLYDDDKEFYHEYKSALQASIKPQHLSKAQQEQIKISIKKIIDTASNLDFDTKNLVKNLKDTEEIINSKIFNDKNIDMQTEDYIHHDLNTQNNASLSSREEPSLLGEETGDVV